MSIYSSSLRITLIGIISCLILRIYSFASFSFPIVRCIVGMIFTGRLGAIPRMAVGSFVPVGVTATGVSESLSGLS